MFPYDAELRSFTGQYLLDSGLSESDTLELIGLPAFLQGGFLAAHEARTCPRNIIAEFNVDLHYACGGVLYSNSLDRVPEIMNWQLYSKWEDNPSVRAYDFLVLSWRMQRLSMSMIDSAESEKSSDEMATEKKIQYKIDLLNHYRGYVEDIVDKVVNSTTYA